MYLVIAEKPSVSRAIAEVIGAQEREDGYLRGTDCMVSWCFGHLVEYVSPDVYDEKFMKISRSSRKTGKLQSQKIRKISSIS